MPTLVYSRVDANPLEAENAISFRHSNGRSITQKELISQLPRGATNDALVGVANTNGDGYRLVLRSDELVHFPPHGVLRLMLYPKNGVLLQKAASDEDESRLERKTTTTAAAATIETAKTAMNKVFGFFS